MLGKASGLEEELRRWQAERSRKNDDDMSSSAAARERRTVRVNGREVEIVKKPRRSTP